MPASKKPYNISILGAGYVGLSLGVLLSEANAVKIYDIDEEKVSCINSKKSPIRDGEIESFFQKKKLNIISFTDVAKALQDAEITIIAVPTNFDDSLNSFDTSIVEECIANILIHAPESLVVIKSTVPIGFTNQIKLKHGLERIIFSPEFLQEGTALRDNLFPSRIIIGGDPLIGSIFAEVLKKCSHLADPPILFMDSQSAEAVKLFANSYLAMRVAFFNELDGYAMVNNLDAKSIIDGICLDSRIGNFYNNPSFGFGGYCLPKDTQQLISSFHGIPQNLIKSTITANKERKQFIVEQIALKNPNLIGVYKLAMKAGSDNFRFSSMLEIIQDLKSKGFNIIIFEPSIQEDQFYECDVVNDLQEFISSSSIILSNRKDPDLMGAEDKIFTRDIFGNN
jgi:UDPglucose 6-dehydrogenase